MQANAFSYLTIEHKARSEEQLRAVKMGGPIESLAVTIGPTGFVLDKICKPNTEADISAKAHLDSASLIEVYLNGIEENLLKEHERPFPIHAQYEKTGVETIAVLQLGNAPTNKKRPNR